MKKFDDLKVGDVVYQGFFSKGLNFSVDPIKKFKVSNTIEKPCTGNYDIKLKIIVLEEITTEENKEIRKLYYQEDTKYHLGNGVLVSDNPNEIMDVWRPLIDYSLYCIELERKNIIEELDEKEKTLKELIL